mmetsp:Transcript_29901/g.26451  ORF Transcript_29901/g.26451 Transcript_29901/m.26451 type:complete len:97 (+) Transcript_29901:840-1130(+)
MMVVGSRGYSSIDQNILNTIKAIHKANGIRGFYRGVHLASLRIVPTIAIQFIVYDYLKSHSSLNETEPSVGILNSNLSFGEPNKNEKNMDAVKDQE